MNVSEQEFMEYIKTFHSSLQKTANKYLPKELLPRLLHLSFLPARIIGYLSTQYGIAIEYIPADKTSIEIKRGSARVEDLLVRAPRKIRNIGPLFRVSGRNIGIFNLTLSESFPFRLDGPDASLEIGDVSFKANGWNRIVTYAEINGNRSRTYWAREKAIARAKDEVLAALVEYKRAEDKKILIDQYIAEFKEKTVLILGDYNVEGDKRLNKLAEVISELGYEPLLIKDVPDHPHHDLIQKLNAIGSIARFIVVDDSSRSGHLSEVEVCKRNNWVMILLRAKGKMGSILTAGASHHSKVILEKQYALSSPEHAVKQAVDWAEAKLKELEKKFEKTYPWR